MPRLPTVGAVLVAFGGLWLCLWQGDGGAGDRRDRRRARDDALTRPPDIVIADIGRFLAARAPTAIIRLADNSREDGALVPGPGDRRGSMPWPAAGSDGGGLDCAGDLCLYTARGRRVALVTGEAALPLECREFDAIVAQVPAGSAAARRSRSSTASTSGGTVRWRCGSTRAGSTSRALNESRGDRPWVPHPRSARERSLPTVVDKNSGANGTAVIQFSTPQPDQRILDGLIFAQASDISDQYQLKNSRSNSDEEGAPAPRSASATVSIGGAARPLRPGHLPM